VAAAAPATPGETPAVESEGGISPDLRIFKPAKVEKNTVVQAYIKKGVVLRESDRPIS
jgi:hypothetical protein